MTTPRTTGGDKDTSVLAPTATGGPDRASLVPEDLPLDRKITEASGDTKEDSIVLQDIVRPSKRVGRLGRGMHLGQYLLGECFGDLKDVSLPAGGLNALLFSLSKLLDMAAERVLQRR